MRLCILHFFMFLVLLFYFSIKSFADEELIKKGEYIFQASGGCSCHTKKNGGAFLSGGRPIKTPFGVFFSTNITPDPESGIGNWSDEDFVDAMTLGISPEGNLYFPVFPYTSFQLIRREDLLALKAYIFSISPVSQKNIPHELILPIGRKISMMLWKNLVWRPKNFKSNPEKTKKWNRGAYLVQALAHCGECHTPRNVLGDFKSNSYLSGSKKGPDGELAPNITPDIKTGIGVWSRVDLSYFLQTGIKPDGNDSQGLMGEVIEQGYKFFNEEDLKAISEYLFSISPIEKYLDN